MDTIPIQDHLIVLRDGKYDTAHGTSQQTLDKIFADLKTSRPSKVVIHFHGGLVDRAAGISAATALEPAYESAGAYPLFFIWESGWREVLDQKLPGIFQENIFKNILTRVTQFAKAKIDKATETGTSMGGDLPLPKETPIRAELNTPSDGQEPFADVDPSVIPETDGLTNDERKLFIEKMTSDPSLDVIGQKVANGVQDPKEEAGQGTARAATIVGSTETLMDPAALNEIMGASAAVEGEKPRAVFSAALLAVRAALVLERVISRFARRRDHGFYLTIVEEILRAFYAGNAGKFLWNGMKADTVDAFGYAEDCGGAQFLTGLQKLWSDPAAWSADSKPALTLVGHSAGAIYACDFLQQVEARKLPPDVKFNLILIAPACTFLKLADTLKSAGNRINALRVFGMNDERERKNALTENFPLLYPSSLLYFVSGLLEDESDMPLAGMERFWTGYYTKGKFPEIDYVRAFALFKKPSSLIWALSAGGGGLSCDMATHGGWAQAPETLKSVQYILDKGYGDAAAAG